MHIKLTKRYSVNQHFHWQCYRLRSAIIPVRLIPATRKIKQKEWEACTPNKYFGLVHDASLRVRYLSKRRKEVVVALPVSSTQAGTGAQR